MDAPSPREIEAAADRLRGHVVATPLIGGLLLPGIAGADGLRVKPEVLQTSGSLYYRGALHWLLRQLGALKGLVLYGDARPVVAAAAAAAQQRLPAVAFTVGEPEARVWRLLEVLGCEVRPRPSLDEARRGAAGVRSAQGFHVMPGAGERDYAAGLATAGLELGAELPAETGLVVVSPADLAHPLALGLAAAGVDARVQGVDEHACAAPPELREAARAGLRLDLGPPSLAALHWALAHGGGGERCAVLAC